MISFESNEFLNIIEDKHYFHIELIDLVMRDFIDVLLLVNLSEHSLKL